MALITCPECGKEISDSAKSCPNCGYENLKADDKPKPRRTELSEVQKNIGAGILYIIIGIIGLIGGIFLVSLIIGIFVIIGAIVMIGYGSSRLHGFQNGTCPYCQSKMEVRANTGTVKCSSCKKICKKSEKYLEEIL